MVKLVAQRVKLFGCEIRLLCQFPQRPRHFVLELFRVRVGGDPVQPIVVRLHLLGEPVQSVVASLVKFFVVV